MKTITEGDHYILYNDTGLSLIDLDYPKAINVGICETTMVGMACGLATRTQGLLLRHHAAHAEGVFIRTLWFRVIRRNPVRFGEGRTTHRQATPSDGQRGDGITAGGGLYSCRNMDD
jgi:hypothetical protein